MVVNMYIRLVQTVVQMGHVVLARAAVLLVAGNGENVVTVVIILIVAVRVRVTMVLVSHVTAIRIVLDPSVDLLMLGKRTCATIISVVRGFLENLSVVKFVGFREGCQNT